MIAVCSDIVQCFADIEDKGEQNILRESQVLVMHY